ncbi:MAG: prolyl oligopeptidase family serine peptidase [Pirellulales bacterium]|nr:prolyl oligopeptidase family serine peptidase [Pirellulales bacterium]
MRQTLLYCCLGIVGLGLPSATAADWTDSLALVYNDGLGHSLPYRLFLPPGYDQPGTDFPLVLFLHGAGERGSNNVSQVNVHIEGLINATQSESFAAYLLAPQVPTDGSWANNLQWDLTRQVLDLVQQGYGVDPYRLYITGLSMGGYGTFDYLMREPDLFAAAVPMSGWGDTSRAALIKDVPIWVFHGNNDTVVPVSNSRAMVAALEAAGGTPVYTETTGGHAIWAPIYNDATNELYPWMFSQSMVGLFQWDALGDADWDAVDAVTGNSHWLDRDGNPATGYPDASFHAVVRTNAVSVGGEQTANLLTIESGRVAVRSGATLTVTNGVNVAADATLEIGGTLRAGSLTAGGTQLVSPSATVSITDELIVNAGLDFTGAALTTVAGATRIDVRSGGRLTVPHPLLGGEVNVAATVETAGAEVTVLNLADGGSLSTSAPLSAETIHLAGGTLDATAEVAANALHVTGGTLSASADVTAPEVTVTSGAVHLGNSARFHVASMEIFGGTVDTGSGGVVVGQRMKIGELTIGTAGGAVEVGGANLADPAVAKNLTLCGGTVSMQRPGRGARKILLVSDQAPGGRDDPMIAWIESLGHSVDTGGMSGAYQDRQNPFEDPAKLAALEDADLVLVSRNARSTFYYMYAQAWNAVETPLVVMSGYLTQGGSGRRWGWVNAGSADADAAEDTMVIEPGLADHPFFTDLTGPVQLFDWTTAPGQQAPAGVRLPVAASQHETDHLLATFGGQPYLLDIPAGYDLDQGGQLEYGATGQRRVFMGHWGYDLDPYAFDSLTTDDFRTLFGNVLATTGPGAIEMPETNLAVTNDTTLQFETVGVASFGDLALQPDVTLRLLGAPLGVEDLAAGDNSAIDGSLVVRGLLSPDDGPAALAITGDLALESGATYQWDCGGSGADCTQIGGTLALADGWTLQIRAETGPTPGDYRLFSGAGTAEVGSVAFDLGEAAHWHVQNLSIVVDDVEGNVYLHVVPEPSTLVLLLPALGIAALRRRRRPNTP